MSLYDGLGVDTESKKSVAATVNKPDVSGWSAGIRMMQSQLRLKKAALTEAQRKIRGATMTPVVDLKKGKPEEEAVSIQGHHLSPHRSLLDTPRIINSSPFLGITPTIGKIIDEYDPSYPNEYEKVLKKVQEKRQQKRDMEWEKDKEKGDRRRRDRGDRGRDRDRDRHRDRERSPVGFSRKPDSDDEDDRDRERPRRKGKQGAAIAPPSILLEDGPTDSFVAPAPVPGASSKNRPYSSIMKKNEQHPERSTTPPSGSQFSDVEGMPLPNPASPASSLEQGPGGFAIPVGMGVDSVAAKIMAKYGFKSGRGLGKKEQGISTALVVEKTSRRGGKIIEHNKDVDFDMPPPMMPLAKQPTPASEVSAVMKNPTKVVLLRNMVGPGEVDEDLQPETAEECTKYGEVAKCIIYEEPNNEEDEAVRIFVEFVTIAAAVKAVVDLNGRFFGGRVVKATFYDPQKFKRFDLTCDD